MLTFHWNGHFIVKPKKCVKKCATKCANCAKTLRVKKETSVKCNISCLSKLIDFNVFITYLANHVYVT